MKARLALALVLVLVAGCATIEFAPRKPVALDRAPLAAQIDSSAPPFASVMPSPSTAAPPRSSIAREGHLKNGIRVIVLEERSHPLIGIGVVLQRGSVEAPPGVFDVFVEAMSDGSDLISPKALRGDLYAFAVIRKIDVRKESSVVTAQFVSPLLRDVVRMIVPAFATPSFESDDVELLIDQHKRKASRTRDEPGARARRELYKLLYPGGHPFADDVADVEHPLDGVTRDTLRGLQPFVGADDVTVIAAGDVTLETLTPLLEEALGALKPGARARKPYPNEAATNPAHLVLFDHAHDSQAQIALGFPGVKYDDPDFPALYFLSKVLQDGMRSSLRLAHGSTYGTTGEIRLQRTKAPVVLSAAVDTASAAQAITDTFATIKNVDTRLARPEELSRLKAWILGSYTAYETVDQSLDALTTIAALDLPVDHWAKLQSAIEALSAEELVRVAHLYFDPTHAQLVVLGNGAVLRGALEALGIGPVDVRKVTH